MDKKRVERQEVMGYAGSQEKEMEELKKSYLQNTDILVTRDYGLLLTIICC